MNLLQHDTALLAAPPNAAAARAQVYSVLSALSAKPAASVDAPAPGARELRDWLLRLEVANTQLPYPAELRAIVTAGLELQDDAAMADYARAFAASFEHNERGAPLPLRQEDATGVAASCKAEIVHFYEHFGYELGDDYEWQPDHLTALLEFLHYLAWLEATADAAEELESLRTAQRDFLTRHVCNWLPRIAELLRTEGRHAFLLQVFSGIVAYARADRDWLTADASRS